VRERRAGDGAPILVGSPWERRRQVALRDTPVAAVDRVEAQPEQRAARAHEGVRHHAHDRDQQPNKRVLNAMLHRDVKTLPRRKRQQTEDTVFKARDLGLVP
jgi:hypothetical protein